MKRVFFSYLVVAATLFTAVDNVYSVQQNKDVYVAGSIDRKAVVWKNGVVHALTDGSRNAEALSVFVKGNDVYVVGYERIAENRSIAKLWINGTVHNLTDGRGEGMASSVFVFNERVFVAGYDTEMKRDIDFPIAVPKVWVDGVSRIFTDGTTHDELTSAYARAVYVHGDDVYVGVTEEWGAGGSVLWKNGVPQYRFDNDATISSIFVSHDVYVAGGGKWHGTVWKNGVRQNIELEDKDAIFPSYVNSVFVYGNDVYAAGSERMGENWENSKNVAFLWKNGKAQRLTERNREGKALSVYVCDGDVFVVGYETNSAGQNVAKLWKNGVAQNLTQGNVSGKANSVFVK